MTDDACVLRVFRLFRRVPKIVKVASVSPYREGDRRQDVRDLLAKRMVDLAKRTEPDRMDRAKSKKEKA